MRAPIVTFKRARAQRRGMNLAEVILWQVLRGGRLQRLRFRRQHPIGPYILDFYCPSARLAVEVDGIVHTYADQTAHYAKRDQWLASQGIQVLRFPAKDVMNDSSLNDILAAIVAAAAPSTAFGGPPPPLRGGGT